MGHTLVVAQVTGTPSEANAVRECGGSTAAGSALVST
jgi:hypothetical protein